MSTHSPKDPSQRSLRQQQRQAGMTEYVAVVVMIATSALLLVHFYGDNIRRLFGMSADSLGGDSAHATAALPHQTMRNFGQNNSYVAYAPNPTVDARFDRLSTFAIDVDTASYTLARAQLAGGNLPVGASVRPEEWVNAFRYDLPRPKDGPWAVHTSLARAPFEGGKTLLKVSLQGRVVANADRKPAHLVFLVDTSGSMQGPERLPLVQESLRILVANLNPRDTVALVTYAGAVCDVLPPTPATETNRILRAIDELSAGGGTAMGSGLELAYRHALKTVRPGEVSRVLVFSDGDANLGRNQSAHQMLEAVSGYVKEGVMLTTVGFGMGNYRDDAMEQLADQGNGQSVYVDSREEAERVFGAAGLAGTLETIAKDVKVQVEFDPARVKSYRLVGYENRAVADADFKNDAVDGGELGAGHSVTALYALELAPGEGDLGTVHVRGQHVDGRGAFEVAHAVSRAGAQDALEDADVELRFAAAVALAAVELRAGARDQEKLAALTRLAAGATRALPERSGFVALLQQAMGKRWPALAARL